jgi:hypothetical protein
MTSLGFSFIQESIMKRNSRVKKLPQAMETKVKEAQKQMTKPIEEDDEDDNYEYKQEDNEELPIVDEPVPHPSTVGADLSSFMNTPLPISLPNPSPSQGNNDLLKRLNYMIHLLEEQQDHKTDHVMEEIILYGFLGIFIIFTIDSFVRVGKYTR